MKGQVSTRTFYRENPLTAGHPVKGTQVTILTAKDDGSCLVGDSPVEWDHAANKNKPTTEFVHYENRIYPEVEAVEIVKGKITKLIADGYVFEPEADIEHFINTGEWLVTVHQHPRHKGH